jgi:hypothetical protein
MNDIEIALQSCPQEKWGDTERLLLKTQQHIAGLQRQIEAQTKPLSDEEIMEIFKAYEQMQEYGYVGKKPFQVHLGWTLEDRNNCLMLARAIEAKVRGEK